MIWLLALSALAVDGPLVWKHDDPWRSPRPPERVAVLHAVQAVIAEADTCPEPALDDARRTLEAEGLALDVIRIGDDRVVRIGEGEEHFGAGLLAIRCGPARDQVWQAPHPRYDLHTGDLVLAWFTEGDARAAMWATHHRFRARPGEVRQDAVHPADVSAEPGSLFQAMTLALALGDPDLRFVQIHGYAASTVPGIEAVVSSGEATRPPARVGARIAEVVGEVAVYGEDTRDLGGTRNVQGHLLARWPGRFLHLELSPGARDRLEASDEVRQALARALEGAW